MFSSPSSVRQVFTSYCKWDVIWDVIWDVNSGGLPVFALI